MNKIKLFFQDKQVRLALSILAVFVFAALFAPVLRPGNPVFSVGPPLQPPSAAYPFGTDQIGRDLFAVMLWGSRISILFAFGAAALSMILGTLLGAVSGYIGGVFDDILSRFFEMFYIIPRTFLCILMVAIFGSNLWIMMVIIGLTIWPANAKIMRAQVMTLKNRGYAQAAIVSGAGKLRVLFRHIVPNGIGPTISNSMLQMAQAVLLEAGLSFLGLGDPNRASWGQILNAGQKYINSRPYMIIIPGLAIVVMLLCFNLLGNFLHKVSNTKDQFLQ